MHAGWDRGRSRRRPNAGLDLPPKNEGLGKDLLKTDQGIKCLTAQEAARIAGENPNYVHVDLLHAIERKEFPSWTMKVQIMPFAEIEQAALNPANFVPGIGPSPDKMLLRRLFSHGDAHRYRLGVNHTQLQVNRSKAAEANNYEPNSFNDPGQTNDAQDAPVELHGATGSFRECR